MPTILALYLNSTPRRDGRHASANRQCNSETKQIVNKEIKEMGMGVCGIKPTAPEGEHYQNSVWGWRPLADLCRQLAPEECAHCEYWHSNDGDGLNATDATALAKRLDEYLASGQTAGLIE